MQRSSFIGSAAALGAATFLRGTCLASVAQPTSLAPLVATIVGLPRAAGTAVSAEALAQRIETLFALGENAAFQGSLAAFSSVGAFATASPQLVAAERATVRAPDVAAAERSDAAALAASGVTRTTFAALAPAERNAYLALWSHSAFNTRRRFYGSIRALTFIALYSMPEAWPAIGYHGPFDPGQRAS